MGSVKGRRVRKRVEEGGGAESMLRREEGQEVLRREEG